MSGFGGTDFSLWGSFSKPGLFPKAKIDGPHTSENSLKSKISASSNGTPQTEQAAEKVIYFVIPNEVRNLSLV